MEQKLWKSACAGANGAELGSGAEAQLVRGKTQSNTQSATFTSCVQHWMEIKEFISNDFLACRFHFTAFYFLNKFV